MFFTFQLLLKTTEKYELLHRKNIYQTKLIKYFCLKPEFAHKYVKIQKKTTTPTF